MVVCLMLWSVCPCSVDKIILEEVILEEEDPEDVCDSAENDSKDCFKSPILRLEMKEEEGITTSNSKTEND